MNAIKHLPLLLVGLIFFACENAAVQPENAKQDPFIELAKTITQDISASLKKDPTLRVELTDYLEALHGEKVGQWDAEVNANLFLTDLPSEGKFTLSKLLGLEDDNAAGRLTDMETETGTRIELNIPFPESVNWESDWYVSYGEETEEGILGYKLDEEALVEIVITEAMAKVNPVLVILPWEEVDPGAIENIRNSIDPKESIPGLMEKMEPCDKPYLQVNLRNVKIPIETFGVGNWYSEVNLAFSYLKYYSTNKSYTWSGGFYPELGWKIHESAINTSINTFYIKCEAITHYAVFDYNDRPYFWLILYEYDWFRSKKSIYFRNAFNSYDTEKKLLIKIKNEASIFFDNGAHGGLIYNTGFSSQTVDNSRITFNLRQACY